MELNVNVFYKYFIFWQEHDCKLTQEIIELIDREADLLMRGVKESNLDGLRKRISTLFLQYIKTPTFNPESAKLLKVCWDAWLVWVYTVSVAPDLSVCFDTLTYLQTCFFLCRLMRAYIHQPFLKSSQHFKDHLRVYESQLNFAFFRHIQHV